jgi:transcriptional regulator with XRE-family HTH domain
VIRALTDQEFATFLVNHAAASARLVGARLRDLRRQRAMEQPELARFVGVPVETIDRLESGELDVDFDLEERILGALGVTRDEAFA